MRKFYHITSSLLFFWFFISSFSLNTATGQSESTSWQSTGGPDGGVSVYSILTTGPDTIYTGLFDRGIFRSTDAGESWSRLMADEDIFSLFETSSGRLLAGGSSESYYYDESSESWIETAEFGINAYDQHQDNIMAGADDGRVYFSTDDGVTWDSTGMIVDRDYNIGTNDVAFIDDETIIASTSWGLFTASLADTVWQSTPIGGYASDIIVTEGKIFVATSTEGIQVSEDGGSSWNALSGYQAEEATHLFQASDGTLYATQSPDTLYKSQDGGANWNGLPVDGLPSTDFRSLHVDADGRLMAGIFESGLFIYNPGEQRWELAGPTSTEVNSLVDLGDGNILAATVNSGLKLHDTGTGEWSQGTEMFNNFEISILGRLTEQKLIMGYNKKVYLSEDNGTSWAVSDSGYQVDSFADVNPTALTYDDDYGLFVGTESAGVFYSDDGAVWKHIPEGIPQSFHYETVGDLEIDQDGRVLAAGNWNGLLEWNGADSTWVEVSSTNDEALSNFVDDIAIHPDGTILAGFSLLAAGADEWSTFSLPSDHRYEEIVTIDITGDGVVYVANNHGEVYYSEDSGTSWTEMSGDLPAEVEINDFIKVGDTIFAATKGLGVYSHDATSTSIKGFLAEDEQPLQARLYQNYPNPFNPETTIRFSLSQHANVELNVYNILGRKVAQLVDGPLHAGNHHVRFNASGLSGGIYFYRLEGDGWHQSRKLILLK